MEDNISGFRQEIDDWIESHVDEMSADLGRLMEVKSVKGPIEDGAPYGAGPKAALELAGSILEARGFETQMFEDMVITADLGLDPPELGILAHVDVVDAGEGWNFDPYKMTLSEGKIYGRGALDNKGPAIAAMYAMFCARDICPNLKKGVRLILGSGEEVGCEDIARYRSENTLPPNLFTPDADFPVVNVEKGRITQFFGATWDKDTTLPRVISITGGKTVNVVPNQSMAVVEGLGISEAEAFSKEYSAKTGALISASMEGGRITINAVGTAAHSAVPREGNNAQTALVEMLAAMPFAPSNGFGYIQALNRLFPHGDYNGSALGIAMNDKLSGTLTVNFGVLELSETGFTANFDSRTPACADETDLPGMIRAALEGEGVTLTDITHSKCHHTPENSKFVQTLLRIFEEYTGKPRKCVKTGGQTYAHGIPGGVAFGCAMLGTNYNMHGANEFFGLQELIASVKMFTSAIIDLCS
ncbi:MAG: Sapep family Mn(2+)-dependent dipeptidase [Oscillospiraceae bacterium]|nr:Sapep family Mn(2+)-dependent dipeptidase [Oscillospiraceae bacterium]